MKARRGKRGTIRPVEELTGFQRYLLLIQSKNNNIKIAQIAERIGRKASTLTRHVNGEVKGFPEPGLLQDLVREFGVPLPPEVLGLKEGDMATGFSEPAMRALRPEEFPASTPAHAPTQEVWRLGGSKSVPPGMLPGDYFILDRSSEAVDGSHVVVNIENDVGSADMEIRILGRDYLLPNRPGEQMIFRDDRRVGMMGVLVRSWRDYPGSGDSPKP